MSKSIVQCFLLEPSDQVEVSLRRFCFSNYTENHYHNAVQIIGREPKTQDLNGYPIEGIEHSDPRWPTQCECGYVFQDEDERQSRALLLYKRADTGELYTLGGAPVGAMWNAPWYGDNFKGPDGQTLVVKTPGGDWIIDSKGSDGGRWTRTGTPPNVTATPSILIRNSNKKERYHGWLRNGQLVEC